MCKRALSLLCVALCLCLLAGCADPVGKTVICKDVSVTFAADYLDLSGESYARDADLFYGRGTLIAMALAEAKSDLKTMTLEEYTAFVISGNGLDCTPVAYGAGYRFSYLSPVGDTTYAYTTATFETESNFWIFQLYCPSENLTENSGEIDIILQSIQPYSPKRN